jgi:hypothetical protein
MKINRLTFCFTLAVLFTSAALAADVSHESSIIGKPVMVKTTASLSSKTATLGQKFEVEVAEDISNDKGVIVPAGTKGEGTVIFVRKKGGGGKTGALDLRVDHLNLHSQKLKLRAQSISRGADKKNEAIGMQVAFGLLGAMSVQGEEINLAAGTVISAEFAEDLQKEEIAPETVKDDLKKENITTEKVLPSESL